MINGSYSQSDILREFWSDYHNVIKPRCFSIAGRLRKDLLPLQKKKGPNMWLQMKKLHIIKSKGNQYNVILWVKYRGKDTETAIKTTCWFSYLDYRGRKRIVLLPSTEFTNALIIFTPSFFKEWAEQNKVVEDIEKSFFIWVEGNYVVYHKTGENGERSPKIEVNLDDKGTGLGKFKEPGRYIFEHFIGEDLIEKMQSKVGEIPDPLELWEAYNKVPEKEISREEIDPNYDYWKEQNISALDEIFEKYG